MTFIGCRNHFFPFQVAENSNHHVKRIKAGFERDVFVEIQGAGDHVDGDPDEPLFEIFVRQSPDAYDAQGGGEAVCNRDGAVSKISENQIDY